MSEFNYKQWIQDNKVGPYQKTTLFESIEDRFGVVSKNKHHLIAYPDSKGGYTKAELQAWYQKGQEAGLTRKIEYVDSRQEAITASEESIEEDTYDQTYNAGGSENPQPEDEEFQEGTQDLYVAPGQTNTAIEYYSDAELDMDNDKLPFDYSEPNPGDGADLEAAWKPKPFNNGSTSGRIGPTKYGW